MDIDHMLEKCGDFHRYQLILLICYGFVNMMSSINYFSQTLITFIPKHWYVGQFLATSQNSINLQVLFEGIGELIVRRN